MLVRLLMHRSIESVDAVDGVDANHKYDTHSPFDIIFMDYTMPNMVSKVL
jgi:CheY-like chemotaxis protein